MNKKGNQLPTGKISKGNVTGKIKFNSDFDIILDNKGYITDSFYTYYKSNFQFSDFFNKVIQDKNWIKKPRYLLEVKQGKYYSNTLEGIEYAFKDLISYYRNLDDPLQRLYDGYHDSMFVRFALKIGMFTSLYHWEMVMRGWEEGFRNACRVYYLYVHPKYDPSTGMPYIVFFDTYFSTRLVLEVLNIAWLHKPELQESYEFIRYNHLYENSNQPFEKLEYHINDLDLGII